MSVSILVIFNSVSINSVGERMGGLSLILKSLCLGLRFGYLLISGFMFAIRSLATIDDSCRNFVRLDDLLEVNLPHMYRPLYLSATWYKYLSCSNMLKSSSSASIISGITNLCEYISVVGSS